MTGAPTFEALYEGFKKEPRYAELEKQLNEEERKCMRIIFFCGAIAAIEKIMTVAVSNRDMGTFLRFHHKLGEEMLYLVKHGFG